MVAEGLGAWGPGPGRHTPLLLLEKVGPEKVEKAGEAKTRTGEGRRRSEKAGEGRRRLRSVCFLY